MERETHFYTMKFQLNSDHITLQNLAENFPFSVAGLQNRTSSSLLLNPSYPCQLEPRIRSTPLHFARSPLCQGTRGSLHRVITTYTYIFSISVKSNETLYPQRSMQTIHSANPVKGNPLYSFTSKFTNAWYIHKHISKAPKIYRIYTQNSYIKKKKEKKIF